MNTKRTKTSNLKLTFLDKITQNFTYYWPCIAPKLTKNSQLLEDFLELMKNPLKKSLQVENNSKPKLSFLTKIHFQNGKVQPFS